MRWYSNLDSIQCKNRLPNLSLQASFVHPPLLWVQGSFLVEKKDESLHPCINFRVSLNIHPLYKLQIFQLFHRLSQNLCNHICCWTIFNDYLSVTDSRAYIMISDVDMFTCLTTTSLTKQLHFARLQRSLQEYIDPRCTSQSVTVKDINFLVYWQPMPYTLLHM